MRRAHRARTTPRGSRCAALAYARARPADVYRAGTPVATPQQTGTLWNRRDRRQCTTFARLRPRPENHIFTAPRWHARDMIPSERSMAPAAAVLAAMLAACGGGSTPPARTTPLAGLAIEVASFDVYGASDA